MAMLGMPVEPLWAGQESPIPSPAHPTSAPVTSPVSSDDQDNMET